MREFYLKWESFIDAYGLYILAFLVGVLLMMIVGLIRHPEDFYTIEEEVIEDDDCDNKSAE